MLRNYLLTAIKVLLRNRFFTAINLFGVGVTLAILVVGIALWDHSFGPVYPERKLDRMLPSVYFEFWGPNIHNVGTSSYYYMNKYLGGLKTPEEISICTRFLPWIAYHNDRKIEFDFRYTDAAFWRIMDFRFVEGNPYRDKDVETARRCIVIDERLRDDYFGRGESAVGMDIRLDGSDYRVLGVVKGVPKLRIASYANAWLPVTVSKDDITRKTNHGSFFGIVLARNRSDFPKIREEFATRMARFEFLDETFSRVEGHMLTYPEMILRLLTGDPKIPSWVVEGSGFLLMILFMLLPIFNLVNINVARIVERESEIGVRKSFGATRLTLIGQFIVENIVLSLLGGILGFILALFLLGAINSSGVIPNAALGLNYRVFLGGFFMALLFGLLSGIVPALRMSRLRPADALKGGV